VNYLAAWSMRATFARSSGSSYSWNDFRHHWTAVARLPFLASASPIILLARAWSLRESPGLRRMSLRMVSAPPARLVHSAFCARSKFFAQGLAAVCASLLGQGLGGSGR